MWSVAIKALTASTLPGVAAYNDGVLVYEVLEKELLKLLPAEVDAAGILDEKMDPIYGSLSLPPLLFQQI